MEDAHGGVTPEDERPRLGPDAAADVRTIARGGAVQIAGQISQRTLTFLFTLVAGRVLNPAGYGLYRQIAQVVAIAGQLGMAGFNYSAMRFIARARARGDHAGVRGAARVALRSVAVSSLVVTAAVVAGADLLAGSFAAGAQGPGYRDEFATLLRLGSVYVPLFGFMQVLRYSTQAYKTMVPSVVVGNLTQPFARFALGAAALALGLEVAGAVATLWASMAVGVAVGAWYYVRILTPEERRARPRADAGAMVRFALPQGGSSLLGIQALGLGVIVLGIALESDREVGLFAFALALQGPGGVFLSGIVNIWAPVVSDLYERGEIARLGSLYQTITRWVATFSFPVYAALMLEPDLFAAAFGDAAAGAAPLVVVLAAGNLFYAGTGPTGYVLSMTGRPGVNLVNSVAAVALYAVLGMIAARDHGAIGVAAVDAGVTALVNAARVIEAKVLVGVQPFGRSFLKPVAATLVAAAVLLGWRLLPGDPIALEIAGVAVAAAVYLVVLRALGLDPEERHVWERIKGRALGGRRRRGGDGATDRDEDA